MDDTLNAATDKAHNKDADVEGNGKLRNKNWWVLFDSLFDKAQQLQIQSEDGTHLMCCPVWAGSTQVFYLVNTCKRREIIFFLHLLDWLFQVSCTVCKAEYPLQENLKKTLINC